MTHRCDVILWNANGHHKDDQALLWAFRHTNYKVSPCPNIKMESRDLIQITKNENLFLWKCYTKVIETNNIRHVLRRTTDIVTLSSMMLSVSYHQVYLLNTLSLKAYFSRRASGVKLSWPGISKNAVILMLSQSGP